ncbi:MAG: hypothetical protein ACRCT2_01280, partial [Plesiomonas shigelloides]
MDSSIRARQQEEHQEKVAEYHEARALRTYLKNQILQAVPATYREALADPVTNYSNVSAQDILNHLVITFGTISEQDLALNIKTLETPWDPANPID